MPFVDPVEMMKGSPLAGWTGRFFHSENMTFAHWDIAPDAAPLHEHHHPQEEDRSAGVGSSLRTIRFVSNSPASRTNPLRRDR
jgi:hypothetical protein